MHLPCSLEENIRSSPGCIVNSDHHDFFWTYTKIINTSQTKKQSVT